MIKHPICCDVIMITNYDFGYAYCYKCRTSLDIGKTILSTKECCKNGPIRWCGGSWICDKCADVVVFETQLTMELEKNYGAKVKTCTCGASKTSNPNCHSSWCDGR